MRRTKIFVAVMALAAAGTVPLSTATATPGRAAQTPTAADGVAVARARTLSAEQEKATVTARALGLDARESLLVRDVIRDADGSMHVRYDRTFAELRVIGGDLVVHRSPSGSLLRTDRGASGSVAVASTAVSVSRQTATDNARSRGGFVPARAGAELVIYAAGGAPRPAYEVVAEGVRPDQTPSRLHTVVDARTGIELTRWDDVQQGIGRSIYSGTVPIGTSRGSTGFSMVDRSRGGNWTTDMRGATGRGGGITFTDGDDVWGNFTISSRASAAVDAHYGAQLTWDYFKSAFGRNGVFNNGRGVRSRVHYGNNYVNAFWDGTQVTYGDGVGNRRPLTAIDVASHEISHGVTQATANLEYTGEAGGLNEATSDIFATAVEFRAANANDRGDYLIGERADIFGNGRPLRYMDRPSRDGQSRDCWSTSLARLDPHLSSGVANHFFYLVSEGSGPKTINGTGYNSPTCNGSAVTGIGRGAAERIWYRALTVYMTSTTTHRGARDATTRAARDLYGAGSVQCTRVQRAWAAVSVPAGTASC